MGQINNKKDIVMKKVNVRDEVEVGLKIAGSKIDSDWEDMAYYLATLYVANNVAHEELHDYYDKNCRWHKYPINEEQEKEADYANFVAGCLNASITSGVGK